MCFWRRKKYTYEISFKKQLELNEDKSGCLEVKDDVLLFHFRRIEEKYPLDLISLKFIDRPGLCMIVFSSRKEYAKDIFMDFVERTKDYILDVHFRRA